eukprot:SM000224S07115  [mRNA]  locus=s224:78499:84282:- [translate_table: standard]
MFDGGEKKAKACLDDQNGVRHDGNGAAVPSGRAAAVEDLLRDGGGDGSAVDMVIDLTREPLHDGGGGGYGAKPKLPDNFEEATWRKIQMAVRAIQAKQPVAASLEELYRAVEDLCLHKMAGSLYGRLQEECECHVEVALAALAGGQSPDAIVFLSAVEAAWRDYCDQMLMIRGIALYLDRTYVLANVHARSLWDMGLQLFRKHLALVPDVEAKTVTGLLRLVEKERSVWEGFVMIDISHASLGTDKPTLLLMTVVMDVFEASKSVLLVQFLASGRPGVLTSSKPPCSPLPGLARIDRMGETVDRALLKHLLRMFSALGTYVESFERAFLEGTADFYAAEGARYMQQTDTPDYLKHVELRLHEENERCLQYLDASTRKLLIPTIEKQLLERHTAAILDKASKHRPCKRPYGFSVLMDGNRAEDLQRLYMLFARVSALDMLRVGLGNYIKDTGHDLVMDEEKDKDMVSGLLDLKARLDTIWECSFARNEGFAITLKDAFEHLINLRQNRPAELIAKFIDSKLRAGNKGTSEEELESTLDKVLVLFRFIQGKDVFEAFYKKDLAKRLLLGKSASIDAEKSMISKLKTECGSQFTNKLEGMFKDIELSKEINESFRQSSQARLKLPSGIEMNVHVLTTGYWPTYPPMEVQLPHELNKYQEIFKDFYLSKHSGRRLMWQNSLGHCVLKADYPKGKKELSVSLFQTVVLMLYNDVNMLTLQEIREATGIEDKELRRTLQSLACGKVRVLNKNPKGREVDDNDSFTFNDDFSAPLFRIKVNAIQLKETVEENTSTTERVFQDRQYQIDAAIVRIMKTRKVLSHTLLITELFHQASHPLHMFLKFPIKPADLKKRIESLIDREYLERDKANAQIYQYLA